LIKEIRGTAVTAQLRQMALSEEGEFHTAMADGIVRRRRIYTDMLPGT
jgi:hypothetical protein